MSSVPSVPSVPSGVNNQSSDLELIAAIQTRQVRALDILYDRYGRLVYNVALRVLKNAEEAEDVTQETFLKLWQRCETYRSDRASLGSFLVMMARSKAIDRLRSHTSHHQRLHQWQLAHNASAHPNTPFESATLEERSHKLKTALQQLSESEREVLEKAYYEGLSQSEIAQHQDIPLGTVKSRSRQALKKLRSALRPFL